MRQRPKALVWGGLAAAAVLGLAFAALLVVAIYQPLPLSFYRETIEEALNRRVAPLRLSAEETSWQWDPVGPTLILIGEGMSLHDARGRIIATAPMAEARLPLGPVLAGTLDVTELQVMSPNVVVTRAEDRSFQIAFEAQASAGEQAIFSPGDLRGLADSLLQCQGARLPEVKVEQGSASYRDQTNAVHLLFANMNASVSRSSDAVRAGMAFDLLVGDQRLAFSSELTQDCDSGAKSVVLFADGVNPAVLGEVVPGGSVLYPFELPISGAIRLQLDHEQALSNLEFELVGGAGSLEIAAYTANNLYVNSLGIAGTYDPAGPRLEFDDASIDLIEGDLRFSGSIEERGETLFVFLAAQLHAVDLSALVPRWFAGLHAALGRELPATEGSEETRLVLEGSIPPGRREITASGSIELWDRSGSAERSEPSEGLLYRHLDFRLEGLLMAPRLLVTGQGP